MVKVVTAPVELALVVHAVQLVGGIANVAGGVPYRAIS
jgi:hypothetical protein